MDLGLAGKAVIVTGGSAGIGLATARMFLEEGACVAICGRDQARLHSAVRELANAGEVFAAACDVTDHTSVDYQQVVEHASLVVDTRNAAAKTTGGQARVVKA